MVLSALEKNKAKKGLVGSKHGNFTILNRVVRKDIRKQVTSEDMERVGKQDSKVSRSRGLSSGNGKYEGPEEHAYQLREQEAV